MSYPHTPGERELVARLVAKSDRMEAAAKIREAWDALRVIVSYVAGISVALLIFPTAITLPFLWATVAIWAAIMALRVLLIRRSFRKRDRERLAEVDHLRPSP